MREIVTAYLRQTYPSARIIQELPLRYSTNRIDVAAVTQAEIIAVEIKSGRDVLDRLERQLRTFAPVCSRLLVALAPIWNVQLPRLEKPGRLAGSTMQIPQFTPAQEVIRSVRESHIEIWDCCAETGRFERTEGWGAANKHPWASRALDILHRTELITIGRRHRLFDGDKYNHTAMVDICAQGLKGREVMRAVCTALRARAAFAAGTDAPILDPEPAPALPPAPAKPQGALL